MSFYKLLYNRTSVRKFSKETIETEKIEQLKNTVLLSPSGKKKNHWEFIFIEEKTTLNKLSKCKHHGSKFIENCALAIVIIGSPEISDTWIEDCSIASILLQLQAEELELGSCWVQIDKRQHNDQLSAPEYVKKMLNIPVEKSVLSIIGIGYPIEKKAPNKELELLANKIHFESY